MQRLSSVCPRVLAGLAGLAAASSAGTQIVNGGFETGTLGSWTVYATAPSPTVISSDHHSGTYCALLGNDNGAEPNGNGAMYQQFAVPAGGGFLTFWCTKFTTDSITFDWQDAYILNSSGATLQTIFHTCTSAPWTQQTVNLGTYAGQTIRIAFLVHQDGFGDDTSMKIDDVVFTSGTVSGACCMSDGTCQFITFNACQTAGGAFSGDGVACGQVTCPVQGACCVPSGTGCVLSTSGPCISQGGTYHGDGTSCAAANCPGLTTTGPDVIVGEVWDMSRYGPVGNITAYSIGTDSCNLGDTGVVWFSNTNQHPVISGTMYRMKTVSGAERFEQIGLSWYKHGFLATNADYCTYAGPCNSVDGSHLGAHGCSDIYDSGLNATQNGSGARSELNATTGVFPYPSVIAGDNSSVIGKRCQCFSVDVDPAQNPGAMYFAEARYVVPNDAQFVGSGGTAVNGLNNSSYRQIDPTTLGGNPSFLGLTHQTMPAIQAWKDQDPSITLVNADYTDTTIVSNPITARFIVGAKATALGGGIYHYEYAVYNLNADRSGGSFSVPIPAGAQITNAGFHAPFYHSGEVYDNTAWDSAVTGSAVTWTPHPFSPAQNANAIRWATLYNFRFDANIPPATGSATLGLFKAGSPASLTVAGLPVPGAALCYANCDGSTTVPLLNVSDFTCFLQKFGIGDSYANCDGSTSQPTLNVADFTCFLQKFAQGCP